MNARFDNDGFKKTARNLSVAILLTNAEGRITWTNPAFKKLCGYSLKEIVGRKPGSFLQGPDTDSETIAEMHHNMVNRRYSQVEVLNYHKKGHPYWASISIDPCFDGNGKLEGHVGVAQDISKKKFEIDQMEQDLVALYSTLLNECAQ